MKKALITGITGQDGSYLAEFLLSKNYIVHGIIRRASTFNTQRIDHIYVDPHNRTARLFLHYGDLSDNTVTDTLLLSIKPDEIYHLAAQSHVRVSFDIPEYTGDITALGVVRMLEAIKTTGIQTKFYNASSSEMFGSSRPPQNEMTAFQPRSPYAIAKVYGHWMTVNYRQAYGFFASNGILFNHESPRRGETFLSRKISRAIAHILSGTQKAVYIGNLNGRRDWGFAPEYAEAMWRILQQQKADDFVLGTGESHTVREFIEEAFRYAGLEIIWRGKGLNEKGVVGGMKSLWKHVLKKGDIIIKVDPRYFRPAEVENLRADYTKAKGKLGWNPRIKFKDLIKIMVDYDMKYAGLEPIGEGMDICKKKAFCYTRHDISFYEKIKESC